MDVEGKPGGAAQVSDHLRTEGEVRHEMPVHNVDVNPVGAGGLGRSDRVPEMGEVRGEYRGRELQFSISFSPSCPGRVRLAE
ncbi:MAG: hypothetical protein NVS9B6_16460 [Candidatus Limnocylindrales bacterium]